MAVAKWIWGAGFALAAATAAGAATPTFTGAAAETTSPAFRDTAVGDWSGTVRLKGEPKHLFVHIHRIRAGTYAATVDSPEGSAGAVPATPLAAPEGVLAFAANGGEFHGLWNDNRGRWEGTWAEGGLSAPMTLSINDNSSMRVIARHDDGSRSPIIEIPNGTGQAAIPPDVVPPALSGPQFEFPAEVVPPTAR